MDSQSNDRISEVTRLGFKQSSLDSRKYVYRGFQVSMKMILEYTVTEWHELMKSARKYISLIE